MSEDDGVESWVSTFKLPFLSPEHPSGMATPPLHALASVPFKWEEQPGKPIPCTDIIIRPEPAKSLDLPPCRIAKMPSPTTVLDGPYNLGRPRFSSFRLFREKQSSFDSSSGGAASPQSAVDVLLWKKKKGRPNMARLFGRSLRRRSREKEADEGSFGFSPSSFAGFDSVSMEGKMMARDESFSSTFSQADASTPPRPLWATMYESLKQAIPIPWKRTRKSKRESAP
ncbi:hypothetical protein C2S52_018314 [Perilla frutescens var. hirtella]|nr:hypothetical protein C2S52_018314 [Perilla frutescens var. hirtella]KAH6812033.1 hypothetical protein C2S51_025795 [Perilla frutescens var. frutescens]